MATVESPTVLRADAARNRERIVAAAIEVFSERGYEAPTPEIAAPAGGRRGALLPPLPLQGRSDHGDRPDDAGGSRRGGDLLPRGGGPMARGRTLSLRDGRARFPGPRHLRRQQGAVHGLPDAGRGAPPRPRPHRQAGQARPRRGRPARRRRRPRPDVPDGRRRLGQRGPLPGPARGPLEALPRHRPRRPAPRLRLEAPPGPPGPPPDRAPGRRVAPGGGRAPCRPDYFSGAFRRPPRPALPRD